MARKKIVFVLVEGPSDDNAIGYFLDKLFDKNTVYVHVMHGDITTEPGTTPKNICAKCGAVVKKYALDNHYTKEHFKEVIHLVDTDGVFADSSAIIEDPAAEEVIYTTSNIICKDKKFIEERNRQKSAAIDRLLGCKYIWGAVPYGIYYMSCNLDHVLYDKQNCTDEEKERNSYEFVKAYRGRTEEFKRFINDSEFSVHGEYMETWRFIREQLNSLNRYTNLGLCFPKE